MLAGATGGLCERMAPALIPGNCLTTGSKLTYDFVVVEPSAYLAPLAGFGSCLRAFSNAVLSACKRSFGIAASPPSGFELFFGSLPRSVSVASVQHCAGSLNATQSGRNLT